MIWWWKRETWSPLNLTLSWKVGTWGYRRERWPVFQRSLWKEDVYKRQYQAKYTFDDIIGESPAIKRTLDLALKAAAHNFRVMIEGESGTGKEMFAQAIHNYGERKEGPFIAIDCGALPVELLESELFGYEGGAFTGAKREGKPGVFELAGGGTIFLDEVGNMHMEMQQKLLRCLLYTSRKQALT